MPSTTEALSALIHSWFPTNPYHGTDGQVLTFLESHGYTERAGMIYPPVSAHNVSRYEWYCIRYLVEEWDYGWIGTKDISTGE